MFWMNNRGIGCNRHGTFGRFAIQLYNKRRCIAPLLFVLIMIYYNIKRRKKEDIKKIFFSFIPWAFDHLNHRNDQHRLTASDKNFVFVFRLPSPYGSVVRRPPSIFRGFGRCVGSSSARWMCSSSWIFEKNQLFERVNFCFSFLGFCLFVLINRIKQQTAKQAQRNHLFPKKTKSSGWSFWFH